MIYPLGGLPRTRRKVKTPSQVFAASIHSENVRVSSNQNVPAVDARSSPVGAAAQLDLTFGLLRGARFSSSPPTRHMSGLNTPQYRLHSTPSQGLTRSESSRSESTSPVLSKQQQAASPFSPSSLLNGSTTCPSPVARTRSDGELLSSLKKGGEVEKTSERRKSFEKNFDNNKNGYDRKMVENKLVEKLVERYEKPVDKRKMFERKAVEKKAPACKNQEDRPVNPPKKGVITILQRPQTKEAAAENLAKITGIAVESLQLAKPSRGGVPEQANEDTTRKDVDPVSQVVVTEDLRDTEGGSREAEPGSIHATKGRPGSPKGGKKRSVRENTRISGARSTATSQVVEKAGRQGVGNASNGHSAQAYFEKEEKRNANEQRREASPVSSHSSREGIGASKNPGVLVLSPEDYSSAHTLSDTQSKKSHARNNSSTDAGHRSSEEYVGKQRGVAKSDSFGRFESSYPEIPRVVRSESCEIFHPSSPPTAAAERWAGPAYSNSPPPSTLPFPTFPTQRTKSSLNGVSLGGLLDPLFPEVVPIKSSSAPSSPTRVSAAFFSDPRAEAPRVDPSSATKDLRRILNLDVEYTVGLMEAEVSFLSSDAERLASVIKAKEQQSATQSLKRMLQLG
ncbi:hypothetical protein MPTK1_2g18970 [Marchantia polymorpha subsp. ruderalis]|uniref:Uncharacterized protein n=1 Tax=Marchantia polymorpha TaxID=3197 RepID=A0A2R6W8J7_MARPO|nr:hypothetical protein MARPO_0128s0012 [Marchantia polymorpha]BBN02885.1 hypothetical protein Mp_2g18970 [Marchantia polymorpha subsp. ruderalis]|eukprot:PTQ30188.1 hypothetical protein MARPO_0128s0012 [Marchantia polymorpha]